eukprot:Gb_09754 [translate_table: standard]
MVYAWELPGVAGNACNGLTPTVALQLTVVVYGANLFSVLLEDLEAAWLLECLRTLILACHCNCLQLVCGRWSTSAMAYEEMRITNNHETPVMGILEIRSVAIFGRCNDLNGMFGRHKVNEDSAWPLAPVWLGVRNPTVKV